MSDPIEHWIEELLKLSDSEEKMTEKQIKIIKAAVETFSEKGFSATSTSEIAQKAGVAEGTIFRHYRTKKDLLFSIVTPIMSKLILPFVMRNFSKVLDEPYANFEDFLRAAIRNRFEFAQKNLPVIKVLLQEIPFHPELKQQFQQIVAKQVLERLMKIVLHFQKNGQILDMPPSSVIRMTGTSILGFLLVRFLLLPESDWDDEQEIEQTVHFIMHGLAPQP